MKREKKCILFPCCTNFAAFIEMHLHLDNRKRIVWQMRLHRCCRGQSIRYHDQPPFTLLQVALITPLIARWAEERVSAPGLASEIFEEIKY